MQAIVLVCNRLTFTPEMFTRTIAMSHDILRYKINFFSSPPQMIKDFFL